MIVITNLNENEYSVLPGDCFRLTIEDGFGIDKKIIIEEQITKQAIINYCCSFRFAMEDGRCMGFHLGGFFGNKKELPFEIYDATMFEDLTLEQQRNFRESVGIKLKEICHD